MRLPRANPDDVNVQVRDPLPKCAGRCWRRCSWVVRARASLLRARPAPTSDENDPLPGEALAPAHSLGITCWVGYGQSSADPDIPNSYNQKVRFRERDRRRIARASINVTPPTCLCPTQAVDALLP